MKSRGCERVGWISSLRPARERLTTIVRANRHCWVALVPPMTLVVSSMYRPVPPQPAQGGGDRPGPKRAGPPVRCSIASGRHAPLIPPSAPWAVHGAPDRCPPYRTTADPVPVLYSTVHPHPHTPVHPPTSATCIVHALSWYRRHCSGPCGHVCTVPV